MHMSSNTISIINKTDPPYNSLRIAVFKKDLQQPDQDVVAWVTANPSAGGGEAFITCPDTFEIYVGYADPAYENETVRYISNVITINGYTAMLRVNAVEDDASGQVTVSLEENTKGNPVDGHIQVQMPPVGGVLNHSLKVYIAQDGTPVVPPIPSPPGTTADAEVTPTYYAGFVDNLTPPGALLEAADIASSEVPVKAGQTATVQGNKESGFIIAVT
jgi:hypothetical protein